MTAVVIEMAPRLFEEVLLHPEKLPAPLAGRLAPVQHHVAAVPWGGQIPADLTSYRVADEPHVAAIARHAIEHVALKTGGDEAIVLAGTAYTDPKVFALVRTVGHPGEVAERDQLLAALTNGDATAVILLHVLSIKSRRAVA